MCKNLNSTNDFIKQLESLSEKDVTLFDKIDNIPKGKDFLSDGYIAILCVEGKASCAVADKIFDIQKNDLFLSHPNQFVENAMTSLDFKARGILMSPAYFESLFLLTSNLWNIKMVLTELPLLHLSEDEVRNLSNNMDFLVEKMTQKHLSHHETVIKSLFQAFLYDFLDCIEPKLEKLSYNYTSSEKIFLHFMDLVKCNTPLHRNVKFYADNLCITPKYLSTVCKQNSGKTASAIIRNYAIDNIKRQLRTTDKSVKEIAVAAGFDNLSFFGKYMRREAGMSPRNFRKIE